VLDRPRVDALLGTEMTTKGLRIEKFRPFEQCPVVDELAIKANPTPSQFGRAGRPTTSMSNGQSMRLNITGELNRERGPG
jgi:hypothetical protein